MSRQPFGMGKDAEKALAEGFYLPSKTSRPGQQKMRSHSPGILGKMGLAQPSMSISLAQDVFFLHPSSEGIPTDDEMVTGTVELWLPKPRTLKHLTVRLLGRYDIGWNDSTPYESGVCLERTVSLLKEGEEVSLEKGEHVFEFILIVPANSAPYERCQYGRVRHSITAKAKGLGIAGGDLMSPERSVFCVTNPGLEEASKPPPPLHLKFEGSLDEIGPYSMAMQSQHIMVGGLLLFRLSILFPPMDLLIYSIKVKIIQQFTLRSPVDRSHTSSATQPQSVFILDATHPPNGAKVQDDGRGARSGSQTPRVGPLKALKKDEMYSIIHLARLPNDNHIRPSTAEGTETPITVHHTIQMELTYRPMTEEESNPPPFDSKGKGKEKKEPEPERRKVVMSKPLDVFSCCCFLDSLTLPVYSVLDPNPMPLDAELQLPCVCGMTLKRLVNKHANALLIDGGEDTTIEYVAPPKPENSQFPYAFPSPSTERPAILWEDEVSSSTSSALRRLMVDSNSNAPGAAAAGEGYSASPPPLTPTEERERGRSTSRRGSSPAPSREPSANRGFFRVGSSSDRLFAMTGWRTSSSSSSSLSGAAVGAGGVGGGGGGSESRGRSRDGRRPSSRAPGLESETVSEPGSRVGSRPGSRSGR